MHAVQHDKFERIIVDILTQNPSLAVVLALAEDAEGRQVANIASPKCKKVILQFMHFYRRYEITTLRQPHHQSATCVVHLAFDHMDNNRAVALKFMRFREHFQREIYVRNRGGLDNKFVVGILRYHDPDDDEAFRQETTTKDFADTPYCIVMEMGDRNLYDMLSKENIAGRDWYTIRAIAGQICKCIAHMHNKGFIHGDLKRKCRTKKISSA
jgi:serine/threonine protein kinase